MLGSKIEFDFDSSTLINLAYLDKFIFITQGSEKNSQWFSSICNENLRK